VPLHEQNSTGSDAATGADDDKPALDEWDTDQSSSMGDGPGSAEDSSYFLRAARHGMDDRRKPLVAPDENAEFERIAKALALQLATRRSRRYEPHPRGRQLALRSSLRRSLRYGGVPLELIWRRPRISRSRLLLFCDVSRSMNPYSALFLHFAAAVLQRVAQVEVFIFATELKRVTDLWHDKKWSEIAQTVPACGGGTQFGACLARFFADYGQSLLGSHTTTIILGDGLDAGEPEFISDTMRRLHQHSRVVWLNPLLGLAGYEPTARGMAAALPFVDVFAPAHDLASFWVLVALLGERRADRRAEMS
jgi:uncharacterized protein